VHQASLLVDDYAALDPDERIGAAVG